MNNKSKRYYFYLPLVLLFSVLLIGYTNQVKAMGFLDFMKVYIFSEVDGVVLMQGKPVSGAKVVRTADYKDKIYTETVVSDEQGRFHFNDISVFSMRLFETVIWQKINIIFQEKKYLAWEQLKRNDIQYGELNDPETPARLVKKLNLKCELTNDQNNKQVIGTGLWRRTTHGLCVWD